MGYGLIGLVCLASSVIHAQDAPVVVIVESANHAIQAEGIRGALRDAGVPALSLTDEDAGDVTDVLTVAVRADGRTATVQFRTAQRLEVRFLRTRRPDARGRWLTAPLAGLVRATRAAPRADNTTAEVLDPWSDRPAVMEITEVVDPWAGQPPAQMIATALARVPRSDVLDPWNNQPAVPHTRARFTRPRELVDPWSRERGERLDRPSPRR